MLSLLAERILRNGVCQHNHDALQEWQCLTQCATSGRTCPLCAWVWQPPWEPSCWLLAARWATVLQRKSSSAIATSADTHAQHNARFSGRLWDWAATLLSRFWRGIVPMQTLCTSRVAIFFMRLSGKSKSDVFCMPCADTVHSLCQQDTGQFAQYSPGICRERGTHCPTRAS